MAGNIEEAKSGEFFYKAKKIIRRRKHVIPISIAVVMSIMIAYIRMFPPIYTAEVKVLVEDAVQNENPVEKFYSQLQIFRKSETAATEAELILSNQVAAEVIDTLNLKYDQVYHSFFKNVIDIWKRSWVRKQYKKVKHLFVEEKPLPMGMTKADVERIQTIQGFKSGVKFEPLRNSNVSKIVVKGPTPEVAKIANTLIKVYMKQRLVRHDRAANAARDQISKRLKETKKNLDKAEKALRDYVAKEGVMFDFEKEKAYIGALTEKEMALEEISRNRKGIEKKLEKTYKELAKIEPNIPAGTTKTKNPLVEKLKTELFKRETSLLKLREEYTEDSKEVQEQKQAIEDVKNRIRKSNEDQVRSWTNSPNPTYQKLKENSIMMKTDLASITVQEKALREYIKQLKQSMRQLPEKQYQINKLARNIQVFKKEYILLMGKKNEAEVSAEMESQKTASVQVVDLAHTPVKPKRPKTKLYLFIALLGGIFMGILNDFLFDYMDTTVRFEEDEENVMDLPIFAVIPLLKGSELFYLNGGNKKLGKRLPPLMWGRQNHELGPGAARPDESLREKL
jgi:uncharacterized protein involved in exopolysaccharide biosynthesis